MHCGALYQDRWLSQFRRYILHPFSGQKYDGHKISTSNFVKTSQKTVVLISRRALNTTATRIQTSEKFSDVRGTLYLGLTT
jgi:hypothetical protein